MVTEKTTKKQFIIEMGSNLFEKQGYPATSMRNLAQNVQLEVSSLYSHISSKEEILRHICFEMQKKMHVAIEKIFANTQSPKKKIRNILKSYLKLILDNPSAYGVYHKEYIHLSESYLKEFLEKKTVCNKMCASIIREGIKTGDFRKVDPYIAVKSMFNGMSWVYTMRNPDLKDSHENLFKEFNKLFISGLVR